MDSLNRKKRNRTKQKNLRKRLLKHADSSNSSSELTSHDVGELGESVEMEEGDVEDNSVTIATVCEECEQGAISYQCNDCKCFYCSSCYESVHVYLTREKSESHFNVTRIQSQFLKKDNGGAKVEEDSHVSSVLSRSQSQFVQSQLCEPSGTLDNSSNLNASGSPPSISKVDSADSELPSAFGGVSSEKSPWNVGNEVNHQHYGLRCNKCFVQLVDDKDFLYASAELYVNPEVMRKHPIHGLHHKGKLVYCSNMHCVGRLASSSFANSSILLYRLHPEKTTWVDNYLRNPAYANSDIIKKKTIGITRPYMPSEIEERELNQNSVSWP